MAMLRVDILLPLRKDDGQSYLHSARLKVRRPRPTWQPEWYKQKSFSQGTFRLEETCLKVGKKNSRYDMLFNLQVVLLEKHDGRPV